MFFLLFLLALDIHHGRTYKPETKTKEDMSQGSEPYWQCGIILILTAIIFIVYGISWMTCNRNQTVDELAT